jgi:hypothetical protein
LALLLACRLLARMANLPVFVPLVAFSIIEFYRSLSYGQLPPIAIAALCISASCLQRERWTAAAVAASFSMVEPHVGLPACLALFLWQPQARVALIGMAAGFAALSLIAVGAAANVSYFSQVLPVHQLSELGDPIQYSLTWLLHELGFSDRAALLAGSLNYLLLLVLSVAIASRVAAAFHSKIPLVLFPPAAVVLGGPFVHLFEIGAALPFALYAAGRAPRGRNLAWISVVLLALDWPATKYLRVNALDLLAIVTVAYFVNVSLRSGLDSRSRRSAFTWASAWQSTRCRTRRSSGPGSARRRMPIGTIHSWPRPRRRCDVETTRRGICRRGGPSHRKFQPGLGSDPCSLSRFCLPAENLWRVTQLIANRAGASSSSPALSSRPRRPG